MSYLDDKERVIDLELTSYGRYLLSRGRFKPTFYAFFDDDIIYDGRYVALTESQSSIESRIQHQTPRFSTQAHYTSRELAVFSSEPNIINDLIIGSNIEDEEKISQGLVKVQAQPDRTEVLQQPLAKSNPRTGYAPAWNLSFFKAPLSSSTDHITGTNGPIQNIPQLNVDLQYSINRVAANSQATTLAAGASFGNSGFAMAPGDMTSENFIEFEDGSTIFLTDDALILRIEESNTFFEKENFDIECFEVLIISGSEKLTPLNFYGDSDLYSADFNNEGGFEPGTVEQYFTFEVDEEINPATICPLIVKDKTKNIFQTKIFECEEIVDDVLGEDIYEDIDDTEELCE